MKIAIEQIKFFEDLAKQQRRIWPDSCDYGVLMNSRELRIKIRKNLQVLIGTFETKIEKWNSRYNTGLSRTYTMFIPWEQDEGQYLGTLATFHYTETWYRKKFVSFFTIDFKNGVRRKESGIKAITV